MSLKWEINGLSLDLDLDSYDNMKRYEDAFEQMAEEEKLIPKDGRQSERIRAYCQLFHRLYDRIFGEGTSEKIFSGIPESVKACEGIYLSFIKFVQEQMISSAQERAEWRTKYFPKDGTFYTSEDIAEAAERGGFGGIGMMLPDSCHVDTRDTEPYTNDWWHGCETTNTDYPYKNHTFQRGTVFDGEKPATQKNPLKVTLEFDDHQYSGLLEEM